MKFAEIPVNTNFEADGITYRKVSDLVYVSLANSDIELYVDPLFEAKIGRVLRKVEVDTNPKFVVDSQSRVMQPNPDFIPEIPKYITDPGTRVQTLNPEYTGDANKPLEVEFDAPVAAPKRGRGRPPLSPEVKAARAAAKEAEKAAKKSAREARKASKG